MATVSLPQSVTVKKTTTTTKRNPKGLAVPAVFCPTDVADPFDTAEWEVRRATIKDEKGGVVFEQENCEIPSDWSQLATMWSLASIFTEKLELPSGKAAFASSSTASPERSQTGVWKTAISSRQKKANVSIVIFPGFVSINMELSTRLSGST